MVEGYRKVPLVDVDECTWIIRKHKRAVSGGGASLCIDGTSGQRNDHVK